MADRSTSELRLEAVEEALRNVQGQAAALEELSEQLSLGVHVLEAEITGLAERARSEADEAIEPGPAETAFSTETTSNARSRSSDLDGARLVALNMALEGKPREAVDRYLVEHFEIADPGRLLDEVYAAVNA